MRVLHTADWHLGQRFAGQYRKEEHDHFLDWLFTTVCEQAADVLVVAGDIFDTAHPPAFAQEQYYHFLARLLQSPCRHIVITGGNHDNPHFLQAARPVLQALNVHVVGAAAEAPDAQVICLPDADTPRLVIAAIPYLRDGDLRKSRLGETAEAIEEQLRSGIDRHYQAVADCCSAYRVRGIPVLATGHLFAQGSTLSDTERPIHAGNLGQVSAAVFENRFDYVALGHLHRPQQVGGHPHIRYAGSPIPLSFAEWEYPHQVLLVQFCGAACPDIQVLPVPVRRRLLRRTGSLEELLFLLETFCKEPEELPVWLELNATGCALPEEARRMLQKAAGMRKTDLLAVQVRAFPEQPETPAEENTLLLSNALMQHPEKVFEKLLDQRKASIPADARRLLEASFGELLDSLHTTGEASS